VYAGVVAAARSRFPRPLSRLLPALTMSIPVTLFSVPALTFPLALAQTLRLSAVATASWIAVMYGLSAVVSVALTLRFRQPLLVAWSVAGMALAATFIGRTTFAELCGATVAAGVMVALIGVLGLTEWVSHWVPIPIVMAMVAGAVLPYVAGIFSAVPGAPVMVGGAFAAYILGGRFLPKSVPAFLPAIAAGILGAAFSGKLSLAQFDWALPALRFAVPTFSGAVLIAYAPVLAVLITTNSNLISIVYIRSQGYRPPTRSIDVATGAATAAGSFFGLVPICMGSFFVAPTAGPDAGDYDVRHWSVYFSAAGFAIIALLAGVAAKLLNIIPASLLLALAGVALIGVLMNTLQEAIRGPLKWGPLLTFAIAVSKVSYLGLGPLFWALVIGTAASFLLEKSQLDLLNAP
jgi:benzoate membrane transport protein